MAGAVQRKARFAIVVLVNGWHSAGVADRCRRLWTIGHPLCPGVDDGGRTASTYCRP